ncbi:hypothetical protein HELRODRAFT_106036 [Helobdella robusta]|uniref:Exonuclease domain-containing protein n=1 Tax=Helobdella robusta TaxID=6412 RepID=T1EDZ4_HELRO|nr:hypothetical protein HELRODRAFT_106036 [Helobdella robusta]ESO06160.1 hypothetical protein HELRODRAFT_106036 [Helobdella robusta]
MNNNTDLPEVFGRKRIAHCSDIEPKKPVKHKLRIGVRPSPQQIMLDRMKYFYDNSCTLQNNNSNNNSNNNNNEDKFNSSINKVGNNETNKFNNNLNSFNSSNGKETTSNNQGASSSIKTTSATSSSIKTSSIATSATSSVATLSSNSSSRVLVVYGGGVNSPSHNVNNFAFHKTNNNCIKATTTTTAATTTASPHQKIETSAYSVERSNAAVNKGGPVSLKGSIRIAHKPTTQVASLRPPPNAVVTKQALPYDLRQSVLNSFIDYCLKIYDNETDAFQRALSEEEKLARSSSSRQIYKSHAVSQRVNLSRESSSSTECPQLSPSTPSFKSLSHDYVLGGRLAQETSYSINRSNKSHTTPIVVSPCELYKHLQPYILTREQLLSNGFPVRDVAGKNILIVPSERTLVKKPSLNSKEKICCRCGKGFIVLSNGNYLTNENCFYHWGHSYKKRVAGMLDHQYMCCQSDISAKGCEVAECHVHEENKLTDLAGYVETTTCKPRKNDDYGVFALDCEMVYTTVGCELARVTVVNQDLKAVIDDLVKPDNKVVDYNSRFSGIDERDLEKVTTSLSDLQKKLLSLFNDRTILIGHSLDNDMIALKLIHGKIVDTSVVFPHKSGPPYKRALRNLSTEILKKIIQDGVNGHNSKEDADTCMELILHKVKEDIKKASRFC